MENKQRFSIRKFKTAVGSALLATVIFGTPVLQAVNVLAEEQAITSQHQLQNATNLTEAPKEQSELSKDLQAKAGTSTGQLTYSVSSDDLAKAIKEAQATGVTVTQGETVNYDSLEAAQTDYKNQIDQVLAVKTLQEQANKAYQEAQTKYKAYQVALAKYQEDKAAYDAYVVAKAEYDKAFATYQEAYKAYEAALAENVKAVAKYEQDKLAYDKAYTLYQDKLAKYQDTTAANASKRANYEKALEQYQKDEAAYRTALAKYQSAKALEAEAQAKYKKELEQYKKDEAQYQKDLAKYRAELAEAQKNTGKDGYLSRIEAQELTLVSEPNAQVTISGTAKFASKSANSMIHGDEWSSALLADHSDSYYNAAGTSQATAWVVNGGIGGRHSDGYAMIAKSGDSITATYDNLQNASVGGVKIAKAVYRYDIKQTPGDKEYINLVIYKDPTVTIDASSYNLNKSKKVRITVTPTYFDDKGNQIDLSKHASLLAVSSLNYDFTAGDYESVENLKGLEFIQITGSTVVNTNGVIAATSNNSWATAQPYYNGVAKWDVSDWDVTDNPREYYGAAAFKVTSKEFSFDLVTTTYSEANNPTPSYKGYWQAITSQVKASGIITTEPVPPTAPTPPAPSTTGNEPTPPTKPEEPQYEQAEKPEPPVEPQKPALTEPKKPTEPTPPSSVPVPGEVKEVPEPKEPTKLAVTFHKATYSEAPKPTKGITNEAGEDVTNSYIPKGSKVKFPISVPSLKAGRDETKTFMIEDVIDEGIELDLEAVKAAYPDYDVTYGEDRLLKLTAKENLLKEINKDLTKAFEFTTPELVGRVLNDGKTYTNTLKVTRNDYVGYSTTVEVKTPGRTDKSTTRDSLIQPTKTVLNAKGEAWSGKDVLAGEVVSYPNTWDLDQFKDIKNGDKDKHIHLFVEDIDGTKFTPNLDKFEAIDSTKEAVKGLTVTHVESVDKADDTLKAYLKAAGLYDKIDGDFVAIIPEDMAAFEEAYVKTGKSIDFTLTGTPKAGATGTLKNTSYQISYGNGYKTSTVDNTIKVTTEWEDKNTKEVLKDKVTGDKAEERGDVTNYRYVETVPTDTGVKHLFERLYTTEWVNEQGEELQKTVTDITTKEKGEVTGYTWSRTVDTPTGIKHIFKKNQTSTAKGSLPNTGEVLSFLPYLGLSLIGLALAFKSGLFKKIKAHFNR